MRSNINIIPVNEQNKKVLSYLKDSLRKIFKAQTKILQRVNIGTNFFNAERNQYNANKILNFLINDLSLSDSEDIFLGVFKKDLYAPPLNFIFGLATQYPKSCIISLCRLDPKFYQCKEGNSNTELFYDRIKKEAVHEIGHTIGLDHCENPSCVMHFSNTLAETDQKEYKFCANCKKLIR
ncbi:MAG: archaemetzincin family Zn-dependent metalloprotease [Candidatus Humimicrobiaceae bacterium]